MRLRQAKDKVKEIISKTDVVPALLGERGIGKTEVLKQVAAEMDWGYQAIYPSSLEGPDFMGLVVKDIDAGITRYLAPEFLPVEKSVERGFFPPQGLLVIEELNRAEVQTIHTLYPLLLERRINTHKVHDGWKIAVAINPDNVEYTTVSIDVAALDRLLIIPVEANIEDYSDYCLSTGNYHRDILDYLNRYPNMLLVSEQSDSSFNKAPSPRGWSRVQMLWLAGIANQNNAEGMELVSGLVGSRAAASLFGFLRDRDVAPIPVETVINETDKAIIRLREILTKNRYDVVNLTLRELAHTVPADKPKLASRVESFLMALPEEFQVMFVRVLHTHRISAFHKLMQAWPAFKASCYARIIQVVKEHGAA